MTKRSGSAMTGTSCQFSAYLEARSGPLRRSLGPQRDFHEGSFKERCSLPCPLNSQRATPFLRNGGQRKILQTPYQGL